MNPSNSTCDIRPVHLNDLPALTDELFGSEYRRHRLGFPGEWAGSDLESIPIGPMVDRESFSNIFGFRSLSGELVPSRDWIRSNPVVAQRLTYSGSPDISTLFGLGNFREQMTILKARREAIRQSMGLLERFSNLRSESTGPSLRHGCLYATFHMAAAPDQTPRLESHLLIAQQYRLPNGNEVCFPLEVGAEAVGSLIARCEWRRLSALIGTFGLTSRSKVPNGLFSSPTYKDLDPEYARDRFRGRNRKLVRAEIDDAWKNQAEGRGFGLDRRKALFSAGRLLGNVVVIEQMRRNQELIDEAFRVSFRPGSRLPERRRDQDHDRGPSI